MLCVIADILGSSLCGMTTLIMGGKPVNLSLDAIIGILYEILECNSSGHPLWKMVCDFNLFLSAFCHFVFCVLLLDGGCTVNRIKWTHGMLRNL